MKTSTAAPIQASHPSQPPLSFPSTKKKDDKLKTSSQQAPQGLLQPDTSPDSLPNSCQEPAPSPTPVIPDKKRRRRKTNIKKQDASLFLPVTPEARKQPSLSSSTPAALMASDQADLQHSIAPSLSKPNLDATGNGSARGSPSQSKQQKAQAL